MTPAEELSAKKPSKLLVEKVTQQFGETFALAETTLHVEEGEFVAIVGPSGCGKSTLFNIVSGILKPTSGSVYLNDQETTGVAGKVGYMLQKDLLLPWKTTIENIVLGASLTRRVTNQDKAAAVKMATRYGLGDFINHYPHAMSGGMRQRVALMRTMSFARDVMLLDEPFGALDSQTRMEMQRWLLSVWTDLKSTILFVTHDVDEAIFLADRVVVMEPGPGRIASEHRIELPRPRDVSSPEFNAVRRELSARLHSHHGKKAA
jgi:ABC-type branched-subunit amino acid transport system ATPase component